MASQPGEQTIAVHILPNTSRRQSDNKIWSVSRIYYEKDFF